MSKGVKKRYVVENVFSRASRREARLLDDDIYNKYTLKRCKTSF